MKNKIICIISIIILLLFISGCHRGSLDTVYSNSLDFTEFDNWLMDEVGIQAIPAHIVVKDKITNFADTTISYTELEQLFKDNRLSVDIWENELSNGKYVSEYDLIIVKTSDCAACEYQEENYEEVILSNYRYKDILIYYVNTENCLGEGCD